MTECLLFLASLYFYSRPCGRGDAEDGHEFPVRRDISTHAPAGGATLRGGVRIGLGRISTHAPAGGATRLIFFRICSCSFHFYSRPCGRGDMSVIWTHEPVALFLLTPLREGRPTRCCRAENLSLFLLTPLREGRHNAVVDIALDGDVISTHAPAGGATGGARAAHGDVVISTHAPAGGATEYSEPRRRQEPYFYSRPCGRGDLPPGTIPVAGRYHFYSRPCGRGDSNFPQVRHEVLRQIAER